MKNSSVTRVEKIKSLIRNIPDFPQKGIIFRDITSLFNSDSGMTLVRDEIDESVNSNSLEFNKIVGIESRGFILGALLANAHGKPLVLARKPGKLPGKTFQMKYSLEYGENTLCIQVSDIQKDDRIIIVDDLIATGGSAKAVSDIIKVLGGKVTAYYFLIELDDLKGRKLLEDSGIRIITSVHY
jgi:adenine phosphoribosyltransferase